MFATQNLQLHTESLTTGALTTPGGAGIWQSNAGYLASLGSNLNGGINSAQLLSGNFPGWVALPATATQNAKQVATVALATYAGALAAAQQQAAGFSNEDSHLGAIETDNQFVTGVLQAVQANTEAQLAVAQQVQLLRQLVVMQITLEATRAGEELNERAQGQATSATSYNLGVAP
jgi:P-type conjugative transfer protein TrbJ